MAEPLPPLAAQIAARRAEAMGMTLDDWLAASAPLPRAEDLPMGREAVVLLAASAQRRDRVALFGDYDVDGVCASAVLAETLAQAGARVSVVLPERARDGYGPQPALFAKLGAEHDLVVALDCGIAAAEAIVSARRQGAATLVLDHHEPRGPLPPGVVVDAKTEPDHPLRGLCAGALATVVARAVAAELGLPLPGWQLAALATICDVVPLDLPQNRALVRAGLAEEPRPGVAALARLAGVPLPLASEDVAFVLGPALNAPGRLRSPEPAYRLLTAADEAEAERAAAACLSDNRLRKELTARAIAAIPVPPDATCVAALIDGVPPGIAGVVAGQLATRLGVPVACATPVEGGLARGSVRARNGQALALLRAAAPHLAAWGGHEGAAGFTVEVERFPAFARCFAKAAEEAPPTPARAVDGRLTSFAPLAEVAEALAAFEPLGEGNPPPLFAIPCRIASISPFRDPAHARVTLTCADGSGGQALAFSIAATLASGATGTALVSPRRRGLPQLAQFIAEGGPA